MKIKTFLFLLVGVLSLNVSNLTFADGKACVQTEIEKLDVPEQSRVYISSDQIHIDAEGIFVEIEGEVYQVAQISEDENGFFVPYGAYWKICPNGHPNPPWRWRCKVCRALL